MRASRRCPLPPRESSRRCARSDLRDWKIRAARRSRSYFSAGGAMTEASNALTVVKTAVVPVKPKNIVICADGTGNTANKDRGTNVFKLYEALDLSGHVVNPNVPKQ